MAVLGCYAEDIDFQIGSGLSVVTTAGRFRANYARCALRTDVNGDGIIYQTLAFPAGAVTALWISCQFYRGVNAGNLNKVFGAGIAADTEGVAVAVNENTGQLSIVTVSTGFEAADVTLATTVSSVIAASTLTKIDLQISNFNSGTGVATVYVNGRQVLTYTGDLRVGGATSLNCVCLYGASRNGSTWDCSELIAADEDTRRMSLVTCFPNAAGDANQWTNSYTAIDETTLDESDVVSENTNGEGAQYNLSGLPTGDFAIKAVKACVWASRDTSGLSQIQLGIRSGGTTDLAAAVAVTTGFALYERLMAVNPVTAAAFTEAEIDALQLAIAGVT